MVPNGGNGLVRLANLASIERGESPGQIDRYAQERQITVISNLYNKPLGEAMADANRIIKEMNLPPEYSTGFLGRGKLMKEAFFNFLIAFVLSLIFVYMVLAAQFESFIHPVTIMASIFLSIPFGILSLILAGSTLNIYSVMGLFVLIGVVKKNGILQVDYTNTLRSRGMERNEAQMEANRVRLAHPHDNPLYHSRHAPRDPSAGRRLSSRLRWPLSWWEGWRSLIVTLIINLSCIQRRRPRGQKLFGRAKTEPVLNKAEGA